MIKCWNVQIGYQIKMQSVPALCETGRALLVYPKSGISISKKYGIIANNIGRRTYTKELIPLLIYLQMIEDEADKIKFEQLYHKYRKLMLYVANHILHNPEDAEDAVHEAFVSIARNIKKIHGVNCPETRNYAVVIVERKSIDIINKRTPGQSFEDGEDMLGITIPMPGEESSVADAMAKLPARYREMLLLRYASGYSTREIAAIFDMKQKTVQKVLWRAKELLQKKLEEGGEKP